MKSRTDPLPMAPRTVGVAAKARRTGALAAALALATGAVALVPGEAQAYCQMASCAEKKGPWKVCEPAGEGDCGTPLVWQRTCVGFSLQRDVSSQVALSDAKEVFTKAFDAWTRVNCQGQPPSIEVDYLGTVQCKDVEYSTEKANANLIVFRDDAWPHDDDSVLALTTVTYSMSSGEIYDADMEVNTADHHFTTDDKAPDIDLLSVATHEAGHFLGLAHSSDSEATMFAAYAPGTVGQRTLGADDMAGICAAYSPSAPPHGKCDPTPRHGFSSMCAADQSDETVGQGGESGEGGDDEGGDDGGSGGSGGAGVAARRACSLSKDVGSEGSWPWTGALLVAAASILARRRR